MMRSMGIDEAACKGRGPVTARGWAMVACLLVLASACGVYGVRAEARRGVAAAGGPRAGVARALSEAQQALAAGRPEEAGAWVEAAWDQRGALADDRLVRRALLELPRAVVGERLEAGRRVEEALEALGAGDARRALGLVAPVIERDDAADPLSLARAWTVRGVAAAAASPGQARGWLRRAASGDAGGAQAERARDRARLLLATMAYDAGDEQAAIAGFLRVEPSSGLWRAARTGLAMAQLRIGQPERALKILALLPGGLTGDPERAVLAAMAAHALGQPDAARDIIEDSLEDRARWEEASVAEVLAWQAAHPRGPRLSEPDEGLVPTLAQGAALRSLGDELRGAREELEARPGDRGMAAYVEGLEQAFAEAFEAERAAEAARVAQARRDLETLLPQITPAP
ncbi:MAG: hypothetical protein H6744_16630 [Deltaproteobacteria bacterium]|nr:hypothetical protein [Deltaproteobacteria bacterium]